MYILFSAVLKLVLAESLSLVHLFIVLLTTMITPWHYFDDAHLAWPDVNEDKENDVGDAVVVKRDDKENGEKYDFTYLFDSSKLLPPFYFTTPSNCLTTPWNWMMPFPTLMPPYLKEAKGDSRFERKKKTERRHVCDFCEKLYHYNSQAQPFDGKYIHPLPEGIPREQFYLMWFLGKHDFTWVCTSCLFTFNDEDKDLHAYRAQIHKENIESRMRRGGKNPNHLRKCNDTH